MTPRFCLLILFVLASTAFGHESLPADEAYIEDAPFGLMGSLVLWGFMLGFVVLLCLLIGLGFALGLVIIVGLAAMFGAGGVVTSLVGFATTRKPQVGWRIFSMWMHAGFMLMAGVGIGGFIAPMIWPIPLRGLRLAWGHSPGSARALPGAGFSPSPWSAR